jgi:hypothetical protein
MSRTHLGIQSVIVLAMVAFAGWPQFRPARAQSIWRYVPSAVLQARTLDAARYAGSSAPRVSQPIPDVQPAAPLAPLQAQNAPLEFVPGAVAMLGGKVNALVGLARNSLNAPIPYARVLLRNIDSGAVRERATADELGRFSFVDLEPNAYVVELLGPDGSVVAASSLVTMSRGQVERTEVRVAAAAQTVAVSLGNEMTPTIQDVTMIASSNDVTRTTTTQAPRVTSTGN